MSTGMCQGAAVQFWGFGRVRFCTVLCRFFTFSVIAFASGVGEVGEGRDVASLGHPGGVGPGVGAVPVSGRILR